MKKQQQIENRIRKIKRELLAIGEMRPGSLTRQYKNPGKRQGAYYQISYTHQMKSRTEYIRPEFVGEVRRQVAAYKKFKKLVRRWIDLSIQHAQTKMKRARSSPTSDTAPRHK